jgi:hypothetical protein
MFNARAWNIALRTAHLAAMGILLGGHAFGASAADLVPALWWTIGTGVALATLEAGWRFDWFHQGRGLITLAKLLLILSVPWLWDYRLPILLAVVVLASVGSHVPARFRYYSVLYRRVIRCSGGPGTSGLDEAMAQQGDLDQPEGSAGADAS